MKTNQLAGKLPSAIYLNTSMQIKSQMKRLNPHFRHGKDAAVKLLKSVTTHKHKSKTNMEEFSEEIKPATVYLLTHRTLDLGMAVSLSGYLFNVNEVAAKDRGKHWALIVKFDDEEEVFVCELERFDASFSVHTKCMKQTIDEIKETRKVRRIYKMGETMTSEKEIKSFVDNNEINDEKYNLISRNCQHWAQIMLKDMDIPSYFELDESSTPENPVYKYELFAGNHLGLESKESKSLMYANKVKEVVDEVMEQMTENESLALTDGQKEEITTYIQNNVQLYGFNVDGDTPESDEDKQICKNKILNQIVDVVERDLRSESVIDTCKTFAAKLYKLKESYSQSGPIDNPDSTSNSEASLSKSFSIDSIKSLYKSFAGMSTKE